MAEDTLTFLAVCREGSFLAAGRALGLATSTVSRRVDQLEAHLGVSLLERSPRGVELTEAGRLYRDRARGLERQLAEAEDAVRALMRRPAGRLRVAAPSALVRDPVGPAAVAYLKRFPEVALELIGTDEDVVPDGQTLHLAVRVSRRAPPEHLTRVRLGQVRMRVCASPAWVASRPPLTDPLALAELGCVVLGSGPEAARIRLRRGEESRTLTVPVALFTTSVQMARVAGCEGLGPVGLPEAACADLLAAGRLVELLPGWRLDPVSVVALYAGDRQLPLRVRAFLDLLAERFAKFENQFAESVVSQRAALGQAVSHEEPSP
ncbi:MAG: LysR family transcriptional regulator [Alphaproteobacteria bacterium]|nr:LysR family transcriptional regulator [Alphaproteobacteria bacterium]MCB9792304.1 LysR family transcriptional regulator [Alphaproteobacteria bacterium]